MAQQARLSVDIGGTFTDLVLLRDDGVSYSAKISSTPAQPEEAVITGIVQILAAAELPASAITEVLHGTTVGSNTLLQKAGARTGLITTKGFRDILEIGRLRTPTMFDLSWDKPEPLVPRRYRLEVDERVSGRGEIVRPVDIGSVLDAGAKFMAEGIKSVAICFLNSYKNPANERAAAEAFAMAFPGMALTASIDVLPETGEYERTSTTVVNAYVVPALRGYLTRLEQKLRAFGIAAPLLIGNSNGGLSSAAMAQQRPVFFISSGRSSGAAGAARLGAALGEENLVAFDMGGTTASGALVHRGVLSRTNEYEFRAGMSVPSRFIKAGGYMMRVPTVDVAEVGNGAGSIASIDAGGLLQVGPLSAGARPGPVCYGLGGTRPTVTDANVVLGFLPSELAGGSLQLDVDAARAAIGAQIGAPLGLDAEAAAYGIREVANSNMMRAIRAVTVERGLDPRELTLLAFGGSGPVHACDLARALGMAKVLFPPGPGVFTATGMLAGTVEHHELRSCQLPLEQVTPELLGPLIDAMRDAAKTALAGQGFATASLRLDYEFNLRLKGQDATLPVALSAALAPAVVAGLRRDFLLAYRETYGYAPSDSIEAVSIKLTAHGNADRVLDFLALRPVEPRGPARPAGSRKVYFDRSGWQQTPVLPRSAITAQVSGPAIIESADTTIVLPPGARLEPGPAGSLIATGLARQ